MLNQVTEIFPAYKKVQGRNWLVSALFVQLLPRLLLTFVFSVLVGSAISLLQLSPFSFFKITVICFFLVSALITATLPKKSGVMLLWALVLNSFIQIYQLAIYPDIESPLLRVFPLLLVGMILLFRNIERLGARVWLSVGWVLVNIPSVIGAALYSSMSLGDVLSLFVFAVLYPLVFIYAADSICRGDYGHARCSEIISISVLSVAILPLLLTPIELWYRDTSSLAALQYGRAYWVLGCIVLVWPVLVKVISSWNLLARAICFSAFLLTFLISFSRGAAVVLVLLLLGTVVFNYRSRNKILLTLAVSLGVLALGGVFFMWDRLVEASWYWLLRFNLASNTAIGIDFNLAQSLESGRSEIWQMGAQLFRENPYLGYGIGTSPELFSNLSGGTFFYSSFHGMFLTLLVERGLLGLLGAFFILGRFFYLVWRSSSAEGSRLFVYVSFACFLLFSNTTGIELFLNSSRGINADISVYLFLLLALYENSRPGRKDTVNT